MRCCFISTLLINYTLISMILAHSFHRRIKRGHIGNTFKALLNIYKMNPLRHSKVYQNFSFQRLAARSDKIRSVALNIDSNESTRQKEKKTGAKLREIESIIQHSEHLTTVIDDSNGDFVDTSTPETFMKSSIFNDLIKIELYDAGDKMAHGNVKILVDNVDGKIISDTSVDNDLQSIIAKDRDEITPLGVIPSDFKTKISNSSKHTANVMVAK